MYAVVSKWKVNSVHEAVHGKGRVMREWLRRQPGVHSVMSVDAGDSHAVAIAIYQDEPTYRALVAGEDSPFEKKAREIGLEDFGEWQWSERGLVAD